MINRTQKEITKHWPKEWDTPVVSIRCITYNHEPYIAQALDGFLMQETDFPFEIVVHDDASTDNTANIIREYETKYPQILKPIYETENQFSKRDGSLGRIMNAACRGKYIALCEGDDYWTKSYKLQKQIDFLERNSQYSASAHQSTLIGNGSGPFREKVNSTITMNDLISNSRLFHTASFIYRREQIYSLPGPTKTNSVVSGDKLIFLKAATFGPIYYFDDEMCIYRKHASGASSTTTLQHMRKDLNIVSYMKEIYPKFPKYRYLSFLYGTFAYYPKDITRTKKAFYLLLSLIFSFSYFPENIKVLANKVKNVYGK